MSDSIIIDGQEFGTGLLVPPSRPERLRSYVEAGEPMLSKDDIARILANPRRTPRRKRFGVSVIQNQLDRGACNGWAGAMALWRALMLRGVTAPILSGAGAYANINGGRDVGSMLDDGMRSIVEDGVPPRSMIDDREYRKNRMDPNAFVEAKKYRALEPYRVDTEEELASGLALGFVGVVAVQANNRFNTLNGDGIVSPTDGAGNHAVGVDDVKIIDGKYAFDMFNSWGTSYGQDGRGYLMWDSHFRTTIRNHAFYLIRSARDVPGEDNPPNAA